jgi:serine/threonine-protein kinase
MSSLVGRKLGIYEVREAIGQGGMASVYLGYRADVDRKVAIKVLPPHPGMSPDVKQRFQQEARTIANLQHPHILPLYDYGATPDDILYLVMPYVSGGTLDKLMRRGRLSVERVERIVRELSGALDYAHKQGVVHRDIKPANILLDTEGNALLADFGIAKLATGGADLTGTGVVGTPAYMSPEQTQGFELTARSDLYSFAVVVWEMLTGRGLFDTDNPVTVMMKHATEPVPAISERIPISPMADAVMAKALAKKPEDRYQTAVAFYEAFSMAVRSGGNTDPLKPVMEATTSRLSSSTPQPTTSPLQSPTVGTPYTAPQGTLVPPQTIIVQQSGSNLTTTVILGAAMLVMLVALVIVVAVLSGPGNPPPAPPDQTSLSPAQPPTRSADAITQTLVAQAKPSMGRVSFSTVDKRGDSLSLSLRGIRPAPSGQTYVAWLVNTRTGEQRKLGAVIVDALGNGALSYSAPDGAFLPAQYNAVLLSVESSASIETPAGEVVYHGLVPIELSDALINIFVRSDLGIRGSTSLLDTARADARFTTQHAGLAARAPNVGAMRTHIEHTLNIIYGGEEDYDGNSRGSNPGTKIGLLPTLDNINAALDAATNSPNATLIVQTESEVIRVCVENVRAWLEEIITAEQTMLGMSTLEDAAPFMEISTRFADILNTGIDQNENGEVEPYEGECGLDQIEQFGLIVASMDIVEGAPELR